MGCLRSSFVCFFLYIFHYCIRNGFSLRKYKNGNGKTNNKRISTKRIWMRRRNIIAKNDLRLTTPLKELNVFVPHVRLFCRFLQMITIKANCCFLLCLVGLLVLTAVVMINKFSHFHCIIIMWTVSRLKCRDNLLFGWMVTSNDNVNVFICNYTFRKPLDESIFVSLSPDSNLVENAVNSIQIDRISLKKLDCSSEPNSYAI